MMGKVILGTVPFSAIRGNYASTFTATGNLITTTNSQALFNGMPVYFIGTTHLSTHLIYYVTNFNGSTTFNLATTFANAIAGTILTFAADSGTVVSAFSGSGEGEYSHTQLLAELAQHSHTVTTYASSGTSAQPLQSNQTTSPLSAVTSTVPASANNPFNVTQPGTFYNMFIKL